MTVQIACYGRLGSDPREQETRSEKPMTTASLAVDVPDRSRDVEEGAGAFDRRAGGAPAAKATTPAHKRAH